MVERTCNTCGFKFEARQADVNRGWARYCSKSCKARSPKNMRHYKRLLTSQESASSCFANNGKGDL